MQLSVAQAQKLLRDELEARGMTQKELAAQLGLSTNYVNMVATGKRKPTGPILEFLGLTEIVTYTYRFKRRRRSTSR